MSTVAARDQFIESAAAWVCDSYSLDIRYLAARDQKGVHLLDALLVATPFPPVLADQELSIDVGNVVAGRDVLPDLSKEQVIQQLNLAADGKVIVKGKTLALDDDRPLDFYSEPHHRETWLANLHLQVIGTQLTPASINDAIKTDRLLRSAQHPFDGMDDLCSWLNLSDVRSNGKACGIKIRVLPPVDLFLDQNNLESNSFHLRLEAHFKLDVKKIGLATREFPGNGIATRKQIANQIKWQRPKDKRRQGSLNVNLKNADSILTMLSVDGLTVRRHWFVDQERAVNARYVATQLFDKELKQLRQAVLPDPGDTNKNDAARFEKGISSLLFLLGFAPGDQVENDAPDIVLWSPSGRMVLIECTLKTSDFRAKLDKLVSRRNELVSKLESTGHNLGVDAALVCALPREHISVDKKYLNQSRVVLLTREDIEGAFYRVRNPVNPDELLKQANQDFLDVLDSLS